MNIVLAPPPAQPLKISEKCRYYVKWDKKLIKTKAYAFMLVSTNLLVLAYPAQRRHTSRPLGCATLVFFSLSACTRLSADSVRGSRNPIGSEKA